MWLFMFYIAVPILILILLYLWISSVRDEVKNTNQLLKEIKEQLKDRS